MLSGTFLLVLHVAQALLIHGTSILHYYLLIVLLNIVFIWRK
jgi:hypothetical protein